MASGPESCHHIGDNDIKCLIIAGIHEEVCRAARGPQGSFSLNTDRHCHYHHHFMDGKEQKTSCKTTKTHNLLVFLRLENNTFVINDNNSKIILSL